MSDPLIVRSVLGDYSVRFGPAAVALAAEPPSTFFLVDDNLWPLHGDTLRSLSGRDRVFSVPAAETFKTADECLRLVERIVQSGFRRGERLAAIGGGVTQDVTAFVASILYRGVTWIFYPTTLLAQADSCIGGKSSINFAGYKNLLGTFNPPREVVIDLAFLETLPPREIRSGIGEILHYFLIDGIDRAEALMAEYPRLLREPARLAPHIHASLEIKKRVIEVDEFDRHVRNLFNYGHTFGHALEAASDYAVSHGEAVTLGMDLANELSWQRGWLDRPTLERMRRVLAPNMPEYVLPQALMPRYFAALGRDKKNTASTLGCILTRGPGRMEKAQLLMDDDLRGSVAAYFHQRTADAVTLGDGR